MQLPSLKKFRLEVELPKIAQSDTVALDDKRTKPPVESLLPVAIAPLIEIVLPKVR